ncbi:MAG: uncharacterized protein QOD06_1166 [Candidatus Binatota bacterium]|jgi:predicted metal-dependent hydrolase|nr:uncharacterized protein [Candidatus Binatota bacterium]
MEGGIVEPQKGVNDPFVDDRFFAAVEQFNQGSFFEAHEIFEELWSEEVGDRRRVLQVLVQAAVGYHKQQIGVPNGARKLFNAALRNLSDLPLDDFAIDLARLRDQLRADLASGVVGTPRIETR